MFCPYCNKEVPWVENKAKYGRNYGRSYMCYWCKDCDAYVGCHNNTKQPLGTMANKELRDWRIKLHAAIDPLWQSGEYKRSEVYQRFTDYFGFDFHVGNTDTKTCEEAIEVVPKLFTPPQD